MQHSIQEEPGRLGVDFFQIILSFRQGRVEFHHFHHLHITTCSTRVLCVQRFPNPLSTQMPEEQPGVAVDSCGTEP